MLLYRIFQCWLGLADSETPLLGLLGEERKGAGNNGGGIVVMDGMG